MRFFKVFTLFSAAVTTAVAAAPMEKRYPIPVGAPLAQPAPAVNFAVKRQANQTTAVVNEIEAAVPKVKDFLAKSNIDLSNLDLGGLGGLLNDLKELLNSDFLKNAIQFINGGGELLSGDAPKIGNQLLTSKLVDTLGKQSTYDTLMPLLSNAKPLLSKEFITNTVNLINTVTGVSHPNIWSS